jgi:hypothetical protein
MTIYCDGSGFNGRKAEYLVLTDTGVVKHEVFEKEFTNNQMEWKAMIEALKLASDGDIIYSDSQLVVYQLTGKYAVHDDKLKPLAELGKKLYQEKLVDVCWLPRVSRLARLWRLFNKVTLLGGWLRKQQVELLEGSFSSVRKPLEDLPQNKNDGSEEPSKSLKLL